MSFSRKDLILLQKYKDDKYKLALIDSVVSLTKHQVFRTAMQGDTLARISLAWANSQQELADLQKEESAVRQLIQSAFSDARVDIQTNHISFVIYEFWEIVVKVYWS
jgi:hypothetical protein